LTTAMEKILPERRPFFGELPRCSEDCAWGVALFLKMPMASTGIPTICAAELRHCYVEAMHKVKISGMCDHTRGAEAQPAWSRLCLSTHHGMSE
jgi:hypothetical protein